MKDKETFDNKKDTLDDKEITTDENKKQDNTKHDGTNQDDINHDNSKYEDICYICRRPESKVGKMMKLPNNIHICSDCM